MGSKPIVGLDIGLSSVKMALVEKKGNEYSLVKYASAILPEGAIIEDEVQKPDEIVEAIRQVAEELGISRMTLYRKLEQYGLRSKN